MKSFNNHSGSRGLPRFIKGIHWLTGSFLRTPFTEGRAGANKKASLPGGLVVYDEPVFLVTTTPD